MFNQPNCPKSYFWYALELYLRVRFSCGYICPKVYRDTNRDTNETLTGVIVVFVLLTLSKILTNRLILAVLIFLIFRKNLLSQMFNCVSNMPRLIF